VANGQVDTNSWCRLTVELKNYDGFTGASIKTNGALVNQSPYYVNESDKTLNAIGFQGTGYIDEVVIRDDDPFAGNAATLTLFFATGIGSVYEGVTQKNSGDTVTSPADLIIVATNFYEIASVTGVDTSWIVNGINQTGGIVTVSSTTNATVTITAQAETSTDPYPNSGAFTNQPADKVATWAIAKGVTALDDNMYNQYLFNIDELADNPTLVINSIAVTNTTVTVMVGAGTNNLSILNGTLKLKAYPVLGGTPVNYTNEVALVGTTNVTVQVNIGTNKFVKALVE
jgi:hypothetical protein